jgi:hypothetical protein
VTEIAPIRELEIDSGQQALEAIASADGPLVMRGLAESWPLVAGGMSSNNEVRQYLKDFAVDVPVHAFIGQPSIDGRIFYKDDLSDTNFDQIQTRLDWVLEQLQQHEADELPPTIYMGSTALDYCVPGLSEKNRLDLPGITPSVRIWIGNRNRVAAHYDALENIACVCAGKRRFTLFPPEQIENLYIGPLDFTPAGQAVSLVDLKQPDFDRFPRFAKALEHAQSAVLEPGDALYVPSMWWHHVESLSRFNVLINHWWRIGPSYMGAPHDVLLHAILSIKDLPERQRAAWRGLFDHYVFGATEGLSDHIPEDQRGILGNLDENAARKIRSLLRNKLNR